jgi:hypothetical protein
MDAGQASGGGGQRNEVVSVAQASNPSFIPWWCQLLTLSTVTGTVLGITHMYNAYVVRKAELDVTDKLLLEGKHMEYGQFAPLNVRILALAGCSGLLLFYIDYIKRRDQRQAEIRSQYWSRYSWIFFIALATFAYFLVTPVRYKLPNLGRAGWADKDNTPTWSTATLRKWFEQSRGASVKSTLPSKVSWFFDGS